MPGMDIATTLREARWQSGLSQRAMAAAAGVSRRVVEDAEAGRRVPRADVLDVLLGAAGLTLDVRPLAAEVDPDTEGRIRAHLHRSLTARVARACGGWSTLPASRRGGPVWVELCRLASLCRSVAAAEGALALSAWIPDLLVPSDQALLLPDHVLAALRPRRADQPRLFSLDVAHDLPPGFVRVVLPSAPSRPGALLVPTPSALAATARQDLRPLLLAAARLLHDEAPRDAGGRRSPAHGQPDEERLERRAARDYAPRSTWATAPRAVDGRAWRLGVAGSFTVDLAERGLVRYPAKPGWSRWGW
jgi:transcriptional regulator with XRE-family HTH domain